MAEDSNTEGDQRTPVCLGLPSFSIEIPTFQKMDQPWENGQPSYIGQYLRFSNSAFSPSQFEFGPFHPKHKQF